VSVCELLLARAWRARAEQASDDDQAETAGSAFLDSQACFGVEEQD
jgi:hypothetical protein